MEKGLLELCIDILDLTKEGFGYIFEYRNTLEYNPVVIKDNKDPESTYVFVNEGKN